MFYIVYCRNLSRGKLCILLNRVTAISILYIKKSGLLCFLAYWEIQPAVLLFFFFKKLFDFEKCYAAPFIFEELSLSLSPHSLIVWFKADCCINVAYWAYMFDWHCLLLRNICQVSSLAHRLIVRNKRPFYYQKGGICIYYCFSDILEISMLYWSF